MSNTNIQTQPQKHGYATLCGIQGHIKALYELAEAELKGSPLPLRKDEILNAVLEKTECALAEIDDLKRQIEVLAIHQETKAERDYLNLPVVDLQGGI